MVSTNEQQAALETRLTELVSTIDQNFILPLRSDLGIQTVRIDQLAYSIDDVRDYVDSASVRQNISVDNTPASVLSR
jgi:hypothetical protein